MPKVENGKPLEVSVSFSIVSIYVVKLILVFKSQIKIPISPIFQDEDKKSVDLKSFLAMLWRDDRLKWEIGSNDDARNVTYAPINMLWTPEILQYNS